MEELKKLNCHPTAEDLYAIVKNRLPQISLATVYRNLDILSEAGEVLKLEMAGKQRRFDGDTSFHYHLRCSECGAVEDVVLPEMEEIQEKLNRIPGGKITNARIEFEGLCDRCFYSRQQKID